MVLLSKKINQPLSKFLKIIIESLLRIGSEHLPKISRQT
jgi:hypothetical protein